MQHDNNMKIYISSMWFNRPTTGRNYSSEQKVNFESPVPFSKCLRDKIYCNMNVHSDPQGCQTLLIKESEPLFIFGLLNQRRTKIGIKFSNGLENR